MTTPESVLEPLRRAWNAGDAPAYGRLFTEDASYVIFLGDALRGRDEIVATHHDVFTRWQKGTRMRVEPISTRMIGPDAAVLLTVGGIGVESTEDIAYDKFQTFVLERRGEEWLIAAFQNTEMSSRARAQYS